MNTKQQWDILVKGKCWLLLRTVADAPSVMTYHFEDVAKVVYPDIHILLIILIWCIINIYENNDNKTFWQSENVGHHCGPLLVVSMLWVVVIDHIILLIRIVSFCYLWIEVKFWWFIDVRELLVFHIWRHLLGFYFHFSQWQHLLLDVWITPNFTCV